MSLCLACEATTPTAHPCTRPVFLCNQTSLCLDRLMRSFLLTIEIGNPGGNKSVVLIQGIRGSLMTYRPLYWSRSRPTPPTGSSPFIGPINLLPQWSIAVSLVSTANKQSGQRQPWSNSFTLLIYHCICNLFGHQKWAKGSKRHCLWILRLEYFFFHKPSYFQGVNLPENEKRIS